MKTITFRKITCTDSHKCSDTILKELENKLNKKLHKYNSSEPKPDGSLSILHTPDNHTIVVNIY